MCIQRGIYYIQYTSITCGLYKYKKKDELFVNTSTMIKEWILYMCRRKYCLLYLKVSSHEDIYIIFQYAICKTLSAPVLSMFYI